MTSDRRTSAPRWSLVLLGLVLGGVCCGCLSSGTSNRPLGGLSAMLPGQKEADLKKKVDADTFPNASQAGVR